MRIVVTSAGRDLDAPASPVFGRCPFYIFVDTDTMEFEAVENPAMSAAGGAGIQAAQFVVSQGVQAVLTGNVGPNAFQVFQAAGVPVLLLPEGTVRGAVEAYKAGRLGSSADANVAAHAGMRGGMGMGRGQGLGSGRRAAPAPAAEGQASRRQEEISTLRQMASDLRKQLAEVIERIDKLEQGG